MPLQVFAVALQSVNTGHHVHSASQNRQPRSENLSNDGSMSASQPPKTVADCPLTPAGPHSVSGQLPASRIPLGPPAATEFVTPQTQNHCLQPLSSRNSKRSRDTTGDPACTASIQNGTNSSKIRGFSGTTIAGRIGQAVLRSKIRQFCPNNYGIDRPLRVEIHLLVFDLRKMHTVGTGISAICLCGTAWSDIHRGLMFL